MRTHADRRRRARRAASILTACLLAAAISRAQPVPRGGANPSGLRLAVIDTLELTDQELRGVVWLGADTTLVLVAEPDTLPDAPPLSTTLVWTGADGDTLRVHDVTGVLSRGLVHDGKWLWSLADATDGRPSSLVQMEADTLYVESVHELPGHRARDLTWDGAALWIVDRDRGRLDRFDPETEEVTRSRTTPGFSPCGVAHDGGFLWVADAGTGRLDRLSKGGSRWNGTVDVDAYFRRGEETALIWGRGALWLLPAGTGYLLATRWE